MAQWPRLLISKPEQHWPQDTFIGSLRENDEEVKNTSWSGHTSVSDTRAYFPDPEKILLLYKISSCPRVDLSFRRKLQKKGRGSRSVVSYVPPQKFTTQR